MSVSLLSCIERGPGHEMIPRRAVVGISWSGSRLPIDPESLAPGDYLAVDLLLEGACSARGEACGGVTAACSCEWVRRERITRDAVDLGDVLDFFGRRVGLVVASVGNAMTIEFDPEPRPAALAGGAS